MMASAYIYLIVLFCVSLRCMISLYPHSGQGKPPMYGDFEAQRHWMEITYHLPMKQWYVNGSDNDLQYWGLDYPPLTAYHSRLLGAISHRINASWVELFTSRGHESYDHKLFMRQSVLSSDILIYIPSVLLFHWWDSNQQRSDNSRSLISMLLTLIYPGIMLIDYGHFQYNCVSLGLTLWAIAFLSKGHDILGAVAFTLALNYKQMSLYFAMPFFAYLLGTCLHAPSRFKGFLKLFALGLVVIGTFVICWLPFLYSFDMLVQVLHRLFPFARGLFEDKVANVWCSLSVILKLKKIFELQTLIRLSLVTTLVAVLPSSLHLLMRPSITSFKYCLINSSLVFFLFSFQVHEKSILLVALPVSLMLSSHPLLCVWFLMISTFSMLPLLIKDGLVGAYFGSMIVFYSTAYIGFRETSTGMSDDSRKMWNSGITNSERKISLPFWLSCVGMICVTLTSLLVAPPRGLPDLHSVVVCCFSCCHFIFFLVVFHWLQFTASDIKSDIRARKAIKLKVK